MAISRPNFIKGRGFVTRFIKIQTAGAIIKLSEI